MLSRRRLVTRRKRRDEDDDNRQAEREQACAGAARTTTPDQYSSPVASRLPPHPGAETGAAASPDRTAASPPRAPWSRRQRQRFGGSVARAPQPGSSLKSRDTLLRYGQQ